ncbi:hypothetical protein A4X13_0g3106 [Tilletia indica]|uniref:LAG1-DNAbind-domain-containing protein n=1 Tax=Tilletia indica TaxID=43049 RepID=A0A177TVF7_9BASI|nr:hypothetical protein A4X13_0g3106 [Tilletia indica]
MSSFSSLWPAGGMNDGIDQEQQGMSAARAGASGSSKTASQQPSSTLEVSSLPPAQPSDQDSNSMELFPDLNQNLGLDAFESDNAGHQQGTSASLFLPPSTSSSEFPHTFPLDPNFSASLPISQSASHQQFQHHHQQYPHLQQQQHFQHAIPSQQQHPSQQPQPQQSHHNSQLMNNFHQQLHPSSSSSSLQATQQHQLQQQQQHQQQQHSDPTGNQTDQFSFAAAPSGTFGVPAGLFGNQYPGFCYGATASGSQSTLADTSFDSLMFNSQEQSFSSLTSNTSQSVPGSQGSRLDALGSNSSLKDAFTDSSGFFQGNEHLGSMGGDAASRRQSSAGTGTGMGTGTGSSIAGLTDQTVAKASLTSADTPPQQSSFDTTVAADAFGQDETQTTPQSNGVHSASQQQQQDDVLNMEDMSPCRQVSAPNSVAGGNQPSREMGPPSSGLFAGGMGSREESGPAAEFPGSASSSHFLSPPGSQSFPQQSQMHPALSNQWQGHGWIPAPSMLGLERPSAMTASLMQPPSSSPVNNSQQQQGSGVSPSGSSRFSFEPSTLSSAVNRGRSSTFSVPPELHLPSAGDNATRPRSSTSSAGSYINSFTSPFPPSSGMSRTNSSASLAVFQPLEQLHISGGGRPGTGGSTQGSVSSQNSGHFQRPGSGGYPFVPSFGASQGAGAQAGGMTPHGSFSHYGAVTTQQSLQGRFQRTDQGGAGQIMSGAGDWQTASVNANRLGVVNPAGTVGAGGTVRKINKLRRAPSNLTLDSGYSSNLSATSFSPSSYGLPSGNASEASPQFEHFASMSSSATSSNALTAGSLQDFSQHYPALPLGSHFSSQTFTSSDHAVGAVNFSSVGSVGGGGMTDASQLGLGAPGSVPSKAPGSGYQTPTIMEEDESRMMQNVLSMDSMMPMFQSSSSLSSAGLTPSMPSSGWSHGVVMDTVMPLESWSANRLHGDPSPLPDSAMSADPGSSTAEMGVVPSATEGGQHNLQPRKTISMPQRSGPSVIVRYGGVTQRRPEDSDDDDRSRLQEEEARLDLQPSTLHHAVPMTMATKFGPCGIPPQLSMPYTTWADYKGYIRDQVCEYLATPSRLGMGERTITIMTPKVGPKSYAGEKRYLCPLPLVVLSGNSWWSADPTKMLTASAGAQDHSHDTTDGAQRQSPMAVLAPPTISIKLLSESVSSQGGVQWTGSDGHLIDGVDGLKNKIPIAGRGLARHLYITEASDEKRKPVYATVTVSMPGPEKPIELGTFSSGPIKVISKTFRKRQGARHSDQSITHGSTVALFFRTRAHTTPGFLCVSGPPTWIRGSDGQPFLKSTISNPQASTPDSNASFIVKSASWDSFVIYAVDPTVSPDEVGHQAPLNPRFPPPPSNAKPIRVDSESSTPILYNQPIVLQCINTGMTSPIMTIRAVEKSTALGGVPLSSKASQSGYVAEAPGEPVSHNHRISLEILDENGENAVQAMVEGDSKSTPGRSGQFLACLEKSVGLRMCGPRKWLPTPTPAEAAPSSASITDADQPKSATPMPTSGGSTSQAAFIAAVAAAQTRHSLAQSRAGLKRPSVSGGSGAAPAASATAGAATSSAASDRPTSADGGKVKRPRRVSSSAVVPKDRTATSGRGRRRGQSLSTVGLGLDPVEPHLKTTASSTSLRGAAANDGAIDMGPGCRWTVDVADSDVWSIMGTEQVHHTFYIPPAIQNGYLPPAVDLGPELSHLVRTPTPKRLISPLPILTSWTHSTTAHLGAGFDPGRETVELHGQDLSKNFFVFFGDFESEVIDATSWRLICTPPPMWDECGVPRRSLPVTLVRDDGIIFPTMISLTLKPQLRIESEVKKDVASSQKKDFKLAAPSSRGGGKSSGTRNSSSGSGGPKKSI